MLDPATKNWSAGGLQRLPLTRLRALVAETIRRSKQ
jgi:hypothetical protein